MTKVSIKIKDQPIVHRIGNWYKNQDGTVFVLANVSGKAVMITSYGQFWNDPIEYGSGTAYWELTQSQFDACCGDETGKFTLIPHITITEGEQA